MKKFLKAFSLLEISIVILVIAILTAGISQGIDLYQDTRIVVANNLTKKSRLSRIKDLAIWLDSSDINNFECYESKKCEEGNKIKVWFDINKNSTQPINVGRNSNGDRTPTFTKVGINNLPSIYFNQDLDQYLSNNEVNNPSQPPISLNNPFYTMIVVWQPISRSTYVNSGWNQSLVSQGATISMTNDYLNLTGSIAYFQPNAIGLWGYWNNWSSNFSTARRYATILIVKNNIINLYHNSLTVNSGTFGTTKVGTCEFTIGNWACRRANSSFHGLISEVAVIDSAISDNEAKDIMLYLSKKWEIILK